MPARRMFAWLACVALTAPIGLFALFAFEMPAEAASPAIVQQQSKIEAIHARIREKRDQLQFEALREADIRHQLGETTTAISSVQARIADVQARIDAALASEDRQKRLLAGAREALQLQRDAYRRRIVQMYEGSSDDRLAVLVGTQSLVDFTERWDDLGYVAAEDQREVRARDDAERAVDDFERSIEATVVELQTERDDQTQSRNQLDGLAQQRANLLAVASEHRTHVAAEVQELEEISAQEEAQLEALVRAQEEAAEAERERTGAPTVEPPGGGTMEWPLAGPITSPYGMRLNPFGGGNTEYHPGIDIGVDVGTTVAAAAAGKVIIVGWVSGYGNYIAIDHGGGISTGYGHLSSFYVSVGQEVQRGQAIGASGNTGRSTGPHLIFEVRRNGTPVDPNPYLGAR
jgi:murein DD-endopeptidase MepM/ murein hydrolase activator NlpD